MLFKQMNTNVDYSSSLSTKENIEVFAYNDYRLFLRDWIQEKKRRSPQFSGATFARKAQISSSTLLGMVAKGKRNLSAASIRAFIRGLELHANAAVYFENLVNYNQARNINDQAVYLARLTQLSSRHPIREELRTLSDHLQYISAWYHPIVREFCGLMPQFKERDEKQAGEWISNRMSAVISPRQASMSIELLLRMGLIEAQADGSYKLREQKLLLDPQKADRGIQVFHKSYLEQASRFPLTKPRDEREFQFVTLSMNAADYQGLKEKMNGFWKGLIEEHPMSDEPPGKVVTISMQTVLMGTKGNENKEGRQ
jgi:uncharacterized protein (TIGR02147 family)